MIICIHQRYFIRVSPLSLFIGLLVSYKAEKVIIEVIHAQQGQQSRLDENLLGDIDLKLLFAVNLKSTFTSKNLLPMFNIFYLVLFQSVLDASVTKGRLMCSTQCSLSENFLKWDISAKTRVLVFSAKTKYRFFARFHFIFPCFFNKKTNHTYI